MINSQSSILVAGKFQGKNVVRVADSNSTKVTDDDPILMKRDDDGRWNPVEKLERSVGRDEMSDYGLWQDKQVVKRGILSDTLVRDKDGEIQDDEFVTFAPHSHTARNGRYVETSSFIGAEIAKGDGFSLLREHSVTNFGYQNDAEVLRVQMNDDMWLINR